MGYEARWENSQKICCVADTIEHVLGCICSLTSGKGKVYIYQFDENDRPSELIKVISITD